MVEVEKNKQKEFEKILKGVDFGLAGCVAAAIILKYTAWGERFV